MSRAFGRALLDLLLPETGCAVCGGPREPAAGGLWGPEVCPACLHDIFDRDARARFTPLAGAATALLDGVVAAGPFAGALEKAVLRLKKVPDRRLAGFLAQLLAERLEESLARVTPRWWGIVPVPLHPARLRERGFNQAALLGREIGRRLGAPVREDVCERVRPTPLQSSLARSERLANLDGAFRVPYPAPEWVAGLGGAPAGNGAAGPVIVVDDVLTTGATLAALARALKAAGAGNVWGLVVARAGSREEFGSVCGRM